MDNKSDHLRVGIHHFVCAIPKVQRSFNLAHLVLAQPANFEGLCYPPSARAGTEHILVRVFRFATVDSNAANHKRRVDPLLIFYRYGYWNDGLFIRKNLSQFID